MILGNENLRNIGKFQYLYSPICENAEQINHSFALKEENLEQRCDLLCERLENKRQLTLHQINKMVLVKIIKAINSKYFH